MSKKLVSYKFTNLIMMINKSVTTYCNIIISKPYKWFSYTFCIF